MTDEPLRERLRVALLRALKPLVVPVHAFVERNYHTDSKLRLAHIAGTAMWWQLLGNDYEFRDDDPRTADEVIAVIYGYADRNKPLS